MFCSHCGTPLAEGAAACARCGAPVTAATGQYPGARATAEMGQYPGAPMTAATATHPGARNPSTQTYGPDARRWSRDDKITGAASILLLISLFLPWFSLSFSRVSRRFGIPLGGMGNVTFRGQRLSGSLSGVAAHGYLWLVFVLCAVVVALLVLNTDLDALPLSLPARREMLLGAVCLNLVLVLIAFLDRPADPFGSVSWSFGAFTGLVAAIAACAPLVLPILRSRSARS